jgi:hypothetical protein
MCFVWIWEQTAIISLYNIDWIYNRDGVFTARYGLGVLIYISGLFFVFIEVTQPAPVAARSMAARVLKFWVQIPPWACITVVSVVR